jgi:hydrogenase-4 component E
MMLALLVPPAFSGVAVALAIVMLLAEFAMLRAPFARSQVRLYAFQSLMVSGLALVVALHTGEVGLYVLAGLSFCIKVVLVPAVLGRLLAGAPRDLAGSNRFGVATMVLVSIVAAVVGSFVTQSIPVTHHPLPASALGIATAAILVSFLLVSLRSDVVSQAIGFFALENGVSVASLVLAAGLPLAAEVAFFFDLLVAVVVFAALIRVHHGRAQTLSTTGLDRLQG